MQTCLNNKPDSYHVRICTVKIFETRTGWPRCLQCDTSAQIKTEKAKKHKNVDACLLANLIITCPWVTSSKLQGQRGGEYGEEEWSAYSACIPCRAVDHNCNKYLSLFTHRHQHELASEAVFRTTEKYRVRNTQHLGSAYKTIMWCASPQPRLQKEHKWCK